MGNFNRIIYKKNFKVSEDLHQYQKPVLKIHMVKFYNKLQKLWFQGLILQIYFQKKPVPQLNEQWSKNSYSFYWVQDKIMTILDFSPPILHIQSLTISCWFYILSIFQFIHFFLVPLLPSYSKQPPSLAWITPNPIHSRY